MIDLRVPARLGGASGAGGAGRGAHGLRPGPAARLLCGGAICVRGEVGAEHVIEGRARVSGALLCPCDEIGVELPKGVGGHASVDHRAGRSPHLIGLAVRPVDPIRPQDAVLL